MPNSAPIRDFPTVWVSRDDWDDSDRLKDWLKDNEITVFPKGTRVADDNVFELELEFADISEAVLAKFRWFMAEGRQDAS
ncbi:hypothetical protein [Beijerinckia sp. L45]|uniref:hypothetical protein n=1 Tax=Beijerinckia sp. L45 TaxID=1641855 RepID=UPI00131BEB99|nr:hypothetical protein [Beijerinckia sp. L45]